MFCVECGTKMQSVGIEGDKSAYTCPSCRRVQIRALRIEPGAGLVPIPCIYMYEDALSAAGQLPAVFQPSLFGG
jgi:hypothetical protein